MKIYKCIILLNLVMAFLAQSNGQTVDSLNKINNRFYIGLNGGAMITFSNIKEKDYMPVSGEWQFGGGAIVGYQSTPILGFQGQFIYGNLAGKKTKWLGGNTANLKFDANIIEFGVNATVSLSKWWAPNFKLNQKLDFYGMLGFGVVSFRSRLYTFQDVFVNSTGYSNNGQTTSTRTTEAVFPIGIGVKYKISEKWNVCIETNLRNVNTDKLDAYERQYYYPKDKYSYTFVGVQYIFGKHEKALEWSSLNASTALNSEIQSQKSRIDSLNKVIADIKDNNLDSITALKINPVSNRLTNVEISTVDLTKKVDSLNNGSKSNSSIVLPSVYFKTGKYLVTKANHTNIATIALFLKSNPNVRVKIIAHTDNTGRLNTNNKLAQKRANVILYVLTNEYNINPSRLDSEIKVSTEPLSNKRNFINRRVDIIISK